MGTLLSMEIDYTFSTILLPSEVNLTFTETVLRQLQFFIIIFVYMLIESKYKLL